MTICRQCASGADSLSVLISQYGDTGDATREVWVKGVRHLHQQCTGCDCQHLVDVQLAGKSTDRPRMAPLGTINQVVE